MPGAANSPKSCNKKRRRKSGRLTTKKRRRLIEPTEQVWAFRAILDERINDKGDVDYLIDWEDDPDTGEKYEPTWVSHCPICTSIFRCFVVLVLIVSCPLGSRFQRSP